MHCRSSHSQNEWARRRWAAFVSVSLVALSSGCTRDNSNKTIGKNTSIIASVPSGIAIDHAAAEPSSSAARAASAIPDGFPAQPIGKPQTPSWALVAPQPAAAASLFARGITGPIQDTFEGLLACQVAVPGTQWDPVVPFVGSAATALPDIRVQIMSKSAFLAQDTPSGTVVFPAMTLTKDSRLTVKISDDDVVNDDLVAEVSLDAGKGFPLEAKANGATLVCRGVPRSKIAADLKAREAALERALVAMEKATLTVDLARPDSSRVGIDASQKAVLELAAYVGIDDPIVKSGVDRIVQVETKQATRFVDAINAEIAKHPKDEFQSLPSGRVRCHATKRGVVEVEVGARALQHDWMAKNLGPLQFRFIDKHGSEFAPTFDHVFVGDKEIEDLSASLPAKAKVDVELLGFEMEHSPYAIVVREGAKRVFLCQHTTQ